MRKLALLLSATALTAAAGTTADLQGTAFNVDTLAHYSIGPGTTHTHLLFKSAGRQFHAYVVKLDRETAAGMRVKVDVGRDSCQTAEAITSIARRKTTDSRQYLAGINGDFFITSGFSVNHEFGNAILGYPNMACATDGKIVAPDMIDWWNHDNAFFVDDVGDMYIDAPVMSYHLHNSLGTELAEAKSVNYPRQDDELMIYNSYMGNYTKTQGGREMTLELAEGQQWCFNGPVRFKVVKPMADGGNSRIPADGLVVSMGPTCTNTSLDLLDAGDVVTLWVECKLPTHGDLTPAVSEICGGDVRILNDGVVTTEATRWINTPSAQYSRSMVGFDGLSTKLILCSVDAGYAESSGITYYEGADLMKFLGCYNALDLDGGGSTAIWTHSHGIVNHLRDGSERAVGNGIFLCLDAPADNEVASIAFADHAITLPKYGLYRPVIFGYNKYGQLVDTDFKDFTLSADAALGTVQADARSILADGNGTHALTATYGSQTATLAVTVAGSGTPQPRVASVLLDGRKPWPIELQALVVDKYMAVAPMAFSWASADTDVATVDADGNITAVGNGTTTVTGTLGDSQVAITVTVELPTMHYHNVFAAADGSIPDVTLKTAKTACSKADAALSVVPASASAPARGIVNVDYTVSSTRNPRVTVTTAQQIYSRPDSLILDITTTKALKQLVVNLQSVSATRPVALTVDKDVAADVTKRYLIALSDVADVAAIEAFPMTLQSLVIYPEGVNGDGKFTAEILAVHNDIELGGVDDIAIDGPRADGAIDASQPVDYYDLAGRRLSAKPTTPGLYILRQGHKAVKQLIR